MRTQASAVWVVRLAAPAGSLPEGVGAPAEVRLARGELTLRLGGREYRLPAPAYKLERLNALRAAEEVRVSTRRRNGWVEVLLAGTRRVEATRPGRPLFVAVHIRGGTLAAIAYEPETGYLERFRLRASRCMRREAELAERAGLGELASELARDGWVELMAERFTRLVAEAARKARREPLVVFTSVCTGAWERVYHAALWMGWCTLRSPSPEDRCPFCGQPLVPLHCARGRAPARCSKCNRLLPLDAVPALHAALRHLGREAAERLSQLLNQLLRIEEAVKAVRPPRAAYRVFSVDAEIQSYAKAAELLERLRRDVERLRRRVLEAPPERRSEALREALAEMERLHGFRATAYLAYAASREPPAPLAGYLVAEWGTAIRPEGGAVVVELGGGEQLRIPIPRGVRRRLSAWLRGTGEGVAAGVLVAQQRVSVRLAAELPLLQENVALAVAYARRSEVNLVVRTPKRVLALSETAPRGVEHVLRLAEAAAWADGAAHLVLVAASRATGSRTRTRHPHISLLLRRAQRRGWWVVVHTLPASTCPLCRALLEVEGGDARCPGCGQSFKRAYVPALHLIAALYGAGEAERALQQLAQPQA